MCIPIIGFMQFYLPCSRLSFEKNQLFKNQAITDSLYYLDYMQRAWLTEVFFDQKFEIGIQRIMTNYSLTSQGIIKYSSDSRKQWKKNLQCLNEGYCLIDRNTHYTEIRVMWALQLMLIFDLCLEQQVLKSSCES